MTERAALRDKLTSEIATATAADLIAHHKRGALLLLEETLSLIDVGIAFALDDTAQVKSLLESGALARPTPAELADACMHSAEFRFVILQPFVLLQRETLAPASPVANR